MDTKREMTPPYTKIKRILYFVLVILCVSCHRQGEEPVGKTLSVALYPYLQRMDEAKRIITEIWDGQNTGWTLVFDDWNCYLDSPSTDVDVFCIDCLFEQYYKAEGMISAISRTSIADPDDFYDCFDLSGECNGIPFLLCQDFLIYPENDRRMADAVNARDLLNYAGPGSVWTLTAGNMNGIYLRTYADMYGYDGVFHSTDITQDVLENLKPYLALGGAKATRVHGEETAKAFIDGDGRAYICFSEALSMLHRYPEPLSVINFSIADDKRSNYYYADKICINKSVTDINKRKAAILLANLLCSREFLDRYISNGGTPLFYIPARQSVSSMFENAHPVYRTLDSLASAPSAVILYGDPDFREYNNRILSTMSELLDGGFQ